MTPTRGVVLLFISWLEQLRYILLMFSVSEIEAISFDLYILNVICFFFLYHQCAYNSAKSKNKFHLWGSHWRHGDSLLFALACAQVISSCWYFGSYLSLRSDVKPFFFQPAYWLRHIFYMGKKFMLLPIELRSVSCYSWLRTVFFKLEICNTASLSAIFFRVGVLANQVALRLLILI